MASDLRQQADRAALTSRADGSTHPRVLRTAAVADAATTTSTPSAEQHLEELRVAQRAPNCRRRRHGNPRTDAVAIAACRSTYEETSVSRAGTSRRNPLHGGLGVVNGGCPCRGSRVAGAGNLLEYEHQPSRAGHGRGARRCGRLPDRPHRRRSLGPGSLRRDSSRCVTQPPARPQRRGCAGLRDFGAPRPAWQRLSPGPSTGVHDVERVHGHRSCGQRCISLAGRAGSLDACDGGDDCSRLAFTHLAGVIRPDVPVPQS